MKHHLNKENPRLYNVSARFSYKERELIRLYSQKSGRSIGDLLRSSVLKSKEFNRFRRGLSSKEIYCCGHPKERRNSA